MQLKGSIMKVFSANVTGGQVLIEGKPVTGCEWLPVLRASVPRRGGGMVGIVSRSCCTSHAGSGANGDGLRVVVPVLDGMACNFNLQALAVQEVRQMFAENRAIRAGFDTCNSNQDVRFIGLVCAVRRCDNISFHLLSSLNRVSKWAVWVRQHLAARISPASCGVCSLWLTPRVFVLPPLLLSKSE